MNIALAPFAFLIVAFAVFRVTRFFVHDSLFGASLDSGSRFSLWLDRFCFFQAEDGIRLRGTDRSWVRGKLHDLLTCPYCLGFWISLGATCIALKVAPWNLGIDGWFTAWAVAGASALVYQVTIKLMK